MTTDPATLPDDVKDKLIALRAALICEDYNEAWHQLYLIADPACTSFEPWKRLGVDERKPELPPMTTITGEKEMPT